MSVLGTTVFQVPKLGEAGFKLDQVQEQKRRQQQELIQKQVAATGAEQAYAQSGMGLTGKWKQMADGYYDIWRSASIKYEMSGSSSDRAAMEEAGRKLRYASTAGNTILDVSGKAYQKNKAEGFKNVTTSAQESGDLYSGFAFGAFRPEDIVTVNDELYVRDGEKLVPAINSTYLAASPNLNNSFILPAVVQQGKYVNPMAFVQEFSGAISAGTTVANAQKNINTLLDENLKNDQFVADVLTAYAISKNDGLGMVEDPTKIDRETYDKIMALSENEEIVGQAIEWYRNTVTTSVPALWKQSGSGGININYGDNTPVNLRYRDNVTLTQSPADEEAAASQITLDGYLAFPKSGGAVGRGYNDPISGNKYDIVAVGVKEGKIYSQRTVGEGSDYFSMEQGKKYKTNISEMTIDEWDMLPEKTKLEITSELKKQGLDVNMMIEGLKGDSSSNTDFDPNNY